MARQNKSYKGKGKRKPNTKGFPKDELNKDSRDNDPNWYFTNADIAGQAAQLSFQSVLGSGSLEGYEVPTIMKIKTVLNPGCTYNVMRSTSSYAVEDLGTASTSFPVIDDGKAGVNLMASKLYTLLSSFTGRTASYAPQDVAMMILAIASIAEISEHIRRVFGIALTYNFRNRTLPLTLIDSMTIDSRDFTQNISIYRMRFNIAMSRINQIPLLENIAFIRKARDVYQKIYMDDPTDMSQLFYYIPEYAFWLDETGDADGSILRAESIYPNGYATTMAQLLTLLEQQITAVLESSTLNFIYADLLNMANKLNVPTWKFDYLAENYVVMPEYNANALLQLHNLTIMGRPGATDSTWDHAKHKSPYYTNQDIYYTGGADVFCDPDKNNIVYNPIFFPTNNKAIYKWFVDMPMNNPSIEDRIEALRYTSLGCGAVVDKTEVTGPTTMGTSKAMAMVALPDHYVASVSIYRNLGDGSTSEYFGGSVPASSTAIAKRQLALLSQFEHPFSLIEEGSTPGSFGNIFGRLQYYTAIDYAYIKRMLDIMTIGLFDFRS